MKKWINVTSSVPISRRFVRYAETSRVVKLKLSDGSIVNADYSYLRHEWFRFDEAGIYPCPGLYPVKWRYMTLADMRYETLGYLIIYLIYDLIVLKY